MTRTRRDFLLGGTLALTAVGIFHGSHVSAMVRNPAPAETYPIRHTDDEWRRLLGPDRFDVMRRAGTEFPFSSPLDHENRAGLYACAGCSTFLYASAAKFDSGTGWPSFFEPLPHAVRRSSDGSLGMTRTEVHCASCGGHLGHVFPDGPPPTGLRYCMNGIAMQFTPKTA